MSYQGADKLLKGKRIVVTRAAQQAEPLVTQLCALGAEVVCFPTIDFAPPDNWEPLDRAIASLKAYDWLIFTSVNGVSFFWQRLVKMGKGADALHPLRIAAIGPATTQALQQRGVAPDLIPETYVAEALADALGQVEGERILLARANIARKALPDILRARGAQVDEGVAYRTVPAAAAEVQTLLQHPIDVITFTSSSTVKHFVEQVGAEGIEMLQKATIACIGPITAETVRTLGLRPAIVAMEYTIPGLVAALVTHLTKEVPA